MIRSYGQGAYHGAPGPDKLNTIEGFLFFEIQGFSEWIFYSVLGSRLANFETYFAMTIAFSNQNRQKIEK